MVVDRPVGENPDDWTAFDISKSMRMLRTGDEAQVKRELRKLHLRWWHANRGQMERVLAAAGVPGPVIQHVPEIIDTCRECRMWQPQGPDPTPSVEIATKQNEQVEGDILFYKDFKIWHMIDRADRWHAAMCIPGKTGPILCDAITRTWIQIFGPFKFLIIDGEKGLATEEAETMLKRYGTEIRPRAPGQHARMIERRGAILRHRLHTAEE